MKIRPDQLEQAVRAELESYSKEVGREVDLAVTNVAKKALRRIRQAAPERTGAYIEGFALMRTKERNRIVITLYNKTRYMLTHLLERGHRKAKGGWVEGDPHFGPVEEMAEEELVSDITRRLGG